MKINNNTLVSVTNTQVINTTDLDDNTISDLMSSLYYSSYKHNRDEGVTHEALVNIGVGNDRMRAIYDMEKQQGNN